MTLYQAAYLDGHRAGRRNGPPPGLLTTSAYKDGYAAGRRVIDTPKGVVDKASLNHYTRVRVI